MEITDIYAPSVNDFLNKKKLNPSFYPFLTYFRYPLIWCISKSMRSISLDTKFKSHSKNAVKSEIPAKFKTIIGTIVQKVKIAKNDFDEKNIVK